MRKSQITSAMRLTVLTRDNFICRACGFGGDAAYIPFLDCDHAVAETAGGLTNVANLQCLCKHCNVAKAGANWTFPVRVASEPQEVWQHNHKVIAVAFAGDTARRLRKLK